MSTDNQIEANRANALLSTGPSSLDGKAQSRRNALKSGLSSRSLILPENEARLAESRRKSFAASFNLAKPDGFAEVLLTQIAVESVRIERCQQEEQLIRENASGEAGSLRQHERRIAACELGLTIHESPEIVRLKLEMTYHGNEWLKGRWSILKNALETRGTWNAIEATLAQDLTGTPALLRESTGLDSLDKRKALATGEWERLNKVSLERWMQDLKSQDLAEVGVSIELDKRLKMLRRYESASRRAFDRSLLELRRHIAHNTVKLQGSKDLGKSTTPSRDEYQTKPMTEKQLGVMVREINAELDEMEVATTKRVDTIPTAPAPMRPLSRPAVQGNREQRRKLAAMERSA